jgi:hypothetical protein
MDTRPVSYTYRRRKGATSRTTSVAQFPQSGEKKSVQAADKEPFSSAFLADRGCLSAEKTHKHAAA